MRALDYVRDGTTVGLLISQHTYLSHILGHLREYKVSLEVYLSVIIVEIALVEFRFPTLVLLIYCKTFFQVILFEIKIGFFGEILKHFCSFSLIERPKLCLSMLG